jgi:hypothetical protein
MVAQYLKKAFDGGAMLKNSARQQHNAENEHPCKAANECPMAAQS